MRQPLLVPKLGLTMEEGVLVEWMVRPGQAFRAGEAVFVIESEKAANEIAAEGDGVLLETSAEVGATLPVGTVIGWWDDGAAGSAAGAAPVQAAAPAPTPVPAALAPAAAAMITPTITSDVRVPVTPLARRLAKQRGLDLSQVRGSGPRGRIRARDLPATATPAVAAPAAAAVAPPQAAATGLRKPSATEQTIARRLTQSKQQIPHFYLAQEAEVSALLALREQLNAAQSGVRFTINHFIVAAVGRALAELPQANRVWTDDGFLSLAGSDVGMAVNAERGLTVPVLRGVGAMPLADVARAAGAAIERAKAGGLSTAEMTGGAITVSNAGMFDVSYMSSIINPGQSMILGVGSVRELFRPDAQGQPALRREIGLVLSADHRMHDGMGGLAFLKRVVDHLQRPLGLLVS
jgi:pyruvate dehydrogenase E2 component (dihydrolipoamide acetyltransferase)